MVKRQAPKEGDATRRPGQIRLCAWTGKGKYKRCQMPSGISEGGPSYCSWHYQCLRMPKIAEDFEEFCRWREIDRKTYPMNFDRAYLYIDDEIAFATVLAETSNYDWQEACKIFAKQWQEKELEKLPPMEQNKSPEYYINQVYKSMKWRSND